ncbi:MAG: CofH family radical SAM protein [Phycisphaerae bacterium]
MKAGDRPTEEEIIALFAQGSLAEIGQRAAQAKRERFGDQVFWVRNVHLNYTNICQEKCRVCFYSKRLGEAGGYVYGIDEIVSRVGQAVAGGAREVHIVGGINPELKFQYYVDLVGTLRMAFSPLYIKAFTAVEINHLCNISGMDTVKVLEILIEAGLDSLPGGGAEIFSARVRHELFPNKIPGERWLDIHRTAHELGIKTTATMLFGHLETLSERVEHLLMLRDLQDKTGGFVAFVPLPVVGYGKLKEVDGLDAIRTLAMSRLVLDNFEHIKVFWPIWGQKLSQLALSYGADDFDGTVGEYKIVDQTGISVERLKGLIEQAGFTAVERDGRYKETRP